MSYTIEWSMTETTKPADAAELREIADEYLRNDPRLVGSKAARLRALADVLEKGVTDDMVNAAFIVLVARHVDARGEICKGDITRDMVREALSSAIRVDRA